MKRPILFRRKKEEPQRQEQAELQPREKIILDESGMVDLPFLLLTILLVVIGIIMMFSASYASAYVEKGNSTHFFARQGLFALLGIGIMLFVSRVPYHWWRAFYFVILLGTLFILLLVPIIGTEENGAKRWINIFGISFQPSEVAKFTLILSYATIISASKDKMKTFRGMIPCLVILGSIVLLVALEKHLSAIIILGFVAAAMMFLGGVRWYWFAAGIAVAALGLYLYITFMGYASSRLIAWRDPWSDPGAAGYQIIQSLYAIGSGGLMGQGLGRSRQKYLYLPEEHNDYIFPIVCEELGFVGAMVIILLFVLLIIRGYWIAIHAKDRFGALLAAGVTTLFALQVFFNIGVVTNFLPATGISLPFFSYGVTALLAQLFEVGVVLSVSRQSTNQLMSFK